jgi:hypothetical protein
MALHRKDFFYVFIFLKKTRWDQKAKDTEYPLNRNGITYIKLLFTKIKHLRQRSSVEFIFIFPPNEYSMHVWFIEWDWVVKRMLSDAAPDMKVILAQCSLSYSINFDKRNRKKRNSSSHSTFNAEKFQAFDMW